MKNNRTFLEKLLDGAEVEWKPLMDLAEIGTGNSNRQDEEENGKYPFYVRSKNILRSNSFQFDETAIIIPGEGGIGDIFHYVEGKYALHQRAYRIHITSDQVNTKFLYYIMHNSFKKYILSKSVGATAISIRKPMLEKFEIPIPPLSVQTEIVRILDALTALTSELTSELILRQKQYEYYREKLLSFDSLEQLNSGGGKKKLIDVAKIKNGKDWKHLGEGNIPIYGSGGIMGYVDAYSYDKPTVLIPRKGTITNIFYLEEPFWNVDTIYYTEIDTTQILPKYFYHFMKTVDLTKLDTGSGRPSLTQAILNEIPIFVPSIEEQQRIVSILDKFETLTNSITEGLPLAIEQSQKRYEYYRELLLSFNGSN
ncbi:restriction endonuclease subunit S [Haemophilus influenzae]|uniref:restriction endonuclease subunit S n=1 Tax=Haemophilus influenzae TaxID=727 RepID=UPI000D01AC97|nr:restriction endonuclease subunit S [Haemophilus influenzae]PRJ14711.1 putative type-1 restriction enzyme specificity protein [Haemophilus influenzae]PRM47017.1 putative type-1 restriction enzyme specificity protein [Haemophilus influenzae]